MPNSHKALGVKRKYFPRERLPAAFFLPDVRTSVAAAAENSPRRPGLAIHDRRGSHSANRKGEPHPTVMRTPAAQPRKARRLCQERVLAGPDTHAFPASPPFKKRLAHSSKGVSRSARLAAGADRPGESSWRSHVAVWRGSGGLGMATSQARFSLGQRYAEPVVPRPTGGPRRNYRPPRSN